VDETLTPSKKKKDRMSVLSARLSIGFSWIAHSFSHLCGPIFYVAVLAMGPELGLSYGDAVALILVGNILLGVAAPFAGWLGDRWSAVGMIGLFFLGTGGGMVMTGLAEGPFMIAFWLAVTGLFASIYHPVGMAWLVRNAVNRGTALGLNGMFGGFGPSAAALMSGALIDGFGWRAAFIVPGTVIVVTGVIFYYLVARGTIVESKGDMRADPPASRSDTIRVMGVLALTMICNGLIYQATQAGLPKLFSIRVTDFADHGAFAISALVAIVYAVAGVMQIFAGWLADRFPLKTVYQLSFVCQALLLFPAAYFSGAPMVIIGILMVTANSGTLPAENCLVARYAPPNRRGLAYGLKFVIALGLSGFGVKLEGMIFDATGGFFWLFVLLSALAAAASAIAFFLPDDRAVS
jgi:MFS transporter, FSR family, fosmidomycin resistance protein